MTDGDDFPKLRLKNGGEIRARAAYADWQMLAAALSTRPDDVQALFKLACENGDSVPADTRAYLRKQYSYWFTADGALASTFSSVLLSAFRDTPDGPALVNPFQLTSQHDLDILEETERHDLRFLRRFFPRGDSAGRPKL